MAHMLIMDRIDPDLENSGKFCIIILKSNRSEKTYETGKGREIVPLPVFMIFIVFMVIFWIQ